VAILVVLAVLLAVASILWITDQFNLRTSTVLILALLVTIVVLLT